MLIENDLLESEETGQHQFVSIFPMPSPDPKGNGKGPNFPKEGVWILVTIFLYLLAYLSRKRHVEKQIEKERIELAKRKLKNELKAI